MMDVHQTDPPTDPRGSTAGGAAGLPSIDQISTMTLAEFKKLISSNLTVPSPSSDGSGDGGSVEGPQEAGAGQGMRRSTSADTAGLSWSSVRDKAKFVCSALASSVSSRRPGGSASPAANLIARRNLPKAPGATPSEARPKTPSSNAERPKTPSGAGADRPKTPSSLFKPRNPVVSAYAYGAKTAARAGEDGGERPEEGSHVSRPKTPQRPKTPTSVDTLTKVPNVTHSGKYSADNARMYSSGEAAGPGNAIPQAKGNNPRVLTTTFVSKADEPLPLTNSARVKTSTFVYTEDTDNASDANSQGHMMRSASWASSNNDSVSLSLPVSRYSHSLEDGLDGEDNSEIAEAMLNGRGAEDCGVGGNESCVGLSLRERPSTPSRIPKPSFPQRIIATTDSSETGSKTPRTLPRPSTPIRSSAEREMSVTSSSDGLSDRPPVTPRKPSLIGLVPRCATPSACTTSKSYAELYQARRAQTPGPGSSSSSSARTAIPGPDVMAIGVGVVDKEPRDSVSRSTAAGPLRKARSVTNLLQESGRLSSVEISDSGSNSGINGSINSIRRGSSGTALRVSSTESQGRQQPQDTYDNGGGSRDGEVLTQARHPQSEQSTPVRGRDRSVAYASVTEKARSRTPGPGVGTGGTVSRYQQQPRAIIRKPNNVPASPSRDRAASNGGKVLNRTEAWVDSTLNDPKCKQLPPRGGRRAVTPNSLSLPESELMSRPLEEIRAALPSPADSLLTPDPDTIKTLPEDPEMYRKMEQLFEKYREMELRASVCETPGGGRQTDVSDRSTTRSSGPSSSQYRSSQSSHSSSSMRTGPSVPHSGSYTSGLASRGGNTSDNGGSLRGSRGPSVESDCFSNDRFSKDGSSPAAAASLRSSSSVTNPRHYGNGAASNNHAARDSRRADTDEARVSVTSRDTSHHRPGAPAASAEDIADDVDALTISADPAELVSEIKEMLAVRPRNESAGTLSKTGGNRSRIPAPAPSASDKSRHRSQSACNLLNGDSSGYDQHPGPSANGDNGNHDATRDESTGSDVSGDFNSRCETPVPKVAQPLITGRSTLFKRDVSGRTLSQDDRVSSSSSLSSSSHRPPWDEDGEYV